MEGMVLGYEGENGVIRTEEGTRYVFDRTDWKSSAPPSAGQRVDFLADEGRAREIYLLATAPSGGTTKNTAAAIFGNSEKTAPAVVYACYLASVLYGVTMIVGVIIAYVYRRDVQGSWLGSHYEYQIRIFWKALFGFVIGFATLFFGIGVVIVMLTYLWVIFKTIKGWRELTDRKPAP